MWTLVTRPRWRGALALLALAVSTTAFVPPAASFSRFAGADAERGSFLTRTAALSAGQGAHTCLRRAAAAESGAEFTPLAPSILATAARRDALVALAPGTKVGKSKVSLGRAIPQIAQPKTETKSASKAAAAKPKQKQETKEEEVPMFKVILLGDEGYDRAHVIASLQAVVPDTDNKRAAEIFDEAQTTGKGMCGVFPQEHAELYVEQLARTDPMIFADIEPE